MSVIWLKRNIWIASLALLSAPMPACSFSQPDQTVSVLYAGSLATVMENGIGPAFEKATGDKYQGEAQGSLGAAQLIRDHLRTPDVFISADPLVNSNLLMGPQNGNAIKWFAVVASSQQSPEQICEKIRRGRSQQSPMV
jgi:molybdate/tungstate transport system substrate-binding protein